MITILIYYNYIETECYMARNFEFQNCSKLNL